MDPRVMNIPQPRSWLTVVAEGPVSPSASSSSRNSVRIPICSVPPYTVISETRKKALDERGRAVELITRVTRESDGTSKTYEYVKREFFPVMPRDPRERFY